jgi:hypothetical protein
MPDEITLRDVTVTDAGDRLPELRLPCRQITGVWNTDGVAEVDTVGGCTLTTADPASVAVLDAWCDGGAAT